MVDYRAMIVGIAITLELIVLVAAGAVLVIGGILWMIHRHDGRR